MIVENRTSVGEQHVGEIIQAPLCRDARLKLAHCSRRRIARIRERGQALLLAVVVHLLKRRNRHQHFATNFEIRGDASPLQLFRRNRKRHRAHGAHVGGYVFANRTVAAGDAANQLAGFVTQGQRHAVELELADVFNVVSSAEFVHAALPIAQLFFAVGVVEREHGRGVWGFDESLARLAAHALRRRIGRDQFDMRGLELFQLVHQAVEFGVRDFGIVEYVVAVLVMANVFAQRLDLRVEVRGGHGQELLYRRARRDRSEEFPLVLLRVLGGESFFSSCISARSRSASSTGTQWCRRADRDNCRRWLSSG